MNVFLTGGTGFIGRPLVQSLLRRGWDVTVLARRPESSEARAVQALGAKIAPGDIGERAVMSQAMQAAGIGHGQGIVIHNAGWYEFGLTRKQQQAMIATNLQGAENVLGEATELGAQRIVHVSSIVAHGPTGGSDCDENFFDAAPPETVYDRSKRAAHEVAVRWQKLGAPLVIASPAGVVGPGDHSTLGYYARLYIRGFGLPLMAGGSRATVHVDDCAEAIALAAEKGRAGEEYILSGGTISNREMMQTFYQVKGGPRFVIWLPRGIGDAVSQSSEPLQRLLGLPNIISREVFASGSKLWFYNGAKATRELGACFRDPRQAWLDTLAGERQRMQQGKSWRYIGP